MIKWNEYTWYSKLLALILFIGVLPAWAFYIGVQYEKTVEAENSQTAIAVWVSAPASSSSSAVSGISGISNGGPSGGAPNMPIITAQDNLGTVTLGVGQRFSVQLGPSLKWSLSFVPAGIVATSSINTSTGSVPNAFQAIAAGTTILHAIGAPICAAEQACPQFLVSDTVTIVVK